METDLHRFAGLDFQTFVSNLLRKESGKGRLAYKQENVNCEGDHFKKNFMTCFEPKAQVCYFIL